MYYKPDNSDGINFLYSISLPHISALRSFNKSSYRDHDPVDVLQDILLKRWRLTW